jgi:pimeloyl-ACP methyl ester carboxylesterase
MAFAAQSKTGVFEAIGDPDGFPVVFHNGTPCGRLMPEWWDAAARARHLRIVCFDRPGYGNRPDEPGRTVAGEVMATARALDDLGVGRFATWGASGGVPYAFGCGALLPDRVVAVAAVAGNAPLGESATEDDYSAELEAVRQTPFDREPLLRTYEADAAPMRRWDVPTLVAEWDGAFSPPDKRALSDGTTGEYLLTVIQEAIRPGVAGWVDDNLAFVSAWGFALSDVRQPVSIWHGDQDLMVPLKDSETCSAAIPHAELFVVPDAGHPSLIFRHGEAVMDWLGVRVAHER